MPTMRLIAATVLFVAILLGGACPPAASPQSSRPSSGAPAVAPQAPSSSGAGTSAESTPERKIIRTASLSLVVADVEDVLAKAGGLAKDMGGYVASSESRDRDGDRVGQASLRVPAERLDEAVTQLKQLASRVLSANTKNQDVTEEFVDQDARLRALQATENQYLQLLQTARTTEDILKIQQALGQVREQIERTQGRLQYLQRSTEMAQIPLDLTTSTLARPIRAAWDAVETLYGAFQGLVMTLTVLASLAIWIAVFAPIWVPTILLLRWWRRRRPPPTPPVAQNPP